MTVAEMTEVEQELLQEIDEEICDETTLTM